MTSNLLDERMPVALPSLDFSQFPMLSRRGFLSGAAALAVGSAAPVVAADEIAGPEGVSRGEFWSRPRSVWLRRAGLGEIRATYWANGALDVEEYRRICVFMRDLGFESAIRRGDSRIIRAVRSGALPEQIPIAAPMSIRLLDGLYAIGGWLEHFGVPRPVQLNSAYRHPFYNNTMVEGAERDGYHTIGGAGDVVIEGVSPHRTSQFGQWLGVGGIGLYASKSFTHMDDGARHKAPRFWRGK